MQYQKSQSVAKSITAKGDDLNGVILGSLGKISAVVGSTLGPGGSPVILERQEQDLPPVITKDGVTVFRSLGFDDPRAQTIMESARDASVKTATEAGDGTTTATVLAEALVRRLIAFTAANKKTSPQRVVRQIEAVFKDIIEPTIVNRLTLKLGGGLLKSDLVNVAALSANGDTALANAVMEAFDVVGDDGNVTIIEASGKSGYSVDRIEGYPILGSGYEDSCGRYYPKFINDASGQRVVVDNPIFLLYHGAVSDLSNFIFILEHVGALWQAQGFRHNLVFVAQHFSDAALIDFAVNFGRPGSINVIPLVAPASPIANGQLHFLEDLAAVTGATVIDTTTLHKLQTPETGLELLGFSDTLKHFEMSRYRSTIHGRHSDDNILVRAEELRGQLDLAGSVYEATLLQERIGKLTGGIARLIISGPSNGETKEKRDRAEDAICAVRGAIKHGALPGGGWTLLRIVEKLRVIFPDDKVIADVVIPALLTPVKRLLSNAGLIEEEITEVIGTIVSSFYDENGFIENGMESVEAKVYDCMRHQHVPAGAGGIFDSTPAVLEAIRNAFSIASQLGLLGGVVCFKRNHSHELAEAAATEDFLRNADVNEANQRA